METGEPKFVADDMVGKLAKWLRILGFDTLYFRRVDDRRLLDIAREQNRILLTRDTALAAQKRARNCILLTDDNYLQQLCRILKTLNLDITIEKVFSRCLICNTKLHQIPKDHVEQHVPEYVFQTQKTFRTCPDCGRIYWGATHVKHVQKTLNILAAMLQL